jgi:transcriptional regulator with XRE-family HTH domain
VAHPARAIPAGGGRKLGISQSAVSQLEALDSRPQKRTREKLAAIYGCKQEQISLYLPKEG